MNIYQEIYRLRKQKNWTQAELAKASKLSLPSIQLIESGKGNPAWETLIKIFKALDVSLSIESKHKVNLNNYFQNPTMRSYKIFLKSLHQEIQKYNEKTLSVREIDIFISILTALYDHYPTWLMENNLFIQTNPNFIRSKNRRRCLI